MNAADDKDDISVHQSTLSKTQPPGITKREAERTAAAWCLICRLSTRQMRGSAHSQMTFWQD